MDKIKKALFLCSCSLLCLVGCNVEIDSSISKDEFIKLTNNSFSSDYVYCYDSRAVNDVLEFNARVYGFHDEEFTYDKFDDFKESCFAIYRKKYRYNLTGNNPEIPYETTKLFYFGTFYDNLIKQEVRLMSNMKEYDKYFDQTEMERIVYKLDYNINLLDKTFEYLDILKKNGSDTLFHEKYKNEKYEFEINEKELTVSAHYIEKETYIDNSLKIEFAIKEENNKKSCFIYGYECTCSGSYQVYYHERPVGDIFLVNSDVNYSFYPCDISKEEFKSKIRNYEFSKDTINWPQVFWEFEKKFYRNLSFYQTMLIALYSPDFVLEHEKNAFDEVDSIFSIE